MTKPKYYKNHEEGYVEAEREYEEYEVTAGLVTDDYYQTKEFTQTAFYVDTETGIVVHDVAMFEGWLQSLVTRNLGGDNHGTYLGHHEV